MAPADEIKYCASLLAMKSRQRARVMARQIAGFERLLDTLHSTTLAEDEAPFDETSVPDSECQNDDDTSIPESESQSQNDDDQSVDASVTPTSQLDKPIFYSGERFGLATKTQLCDNRDCKETVEDITYLRCPSDEAPSGETEPGTVLSHQSQSKFAIRRQIGVHFSKSRSAESLKRESAIPFDEPDPLNQQEVVSTASRVSAPVHTVSSVSTPTLKERYSHHKKSRDDRFHADVGGSIGSSVLDRRWKRHQLSTNSLQRDPSLTRDADMSEVQKARKPIRGRQLFSRLERTSNVIGTLERRRLLHLKEIRCKKSHQGALASNKCSQSRHVRNNLAPDAIYFEESTRLLKTAHSHQNLDAENKVRKRIEGAKTGKFVFQFPIAKSISLSKYAAPRSDEADATPSDEESSLLTGQTHPSLDDDVSSSSVDTYRKSHCFGESSEGQTNLGPLHHHPLDTSESYASRETREVNDVAEELKRKYMLSANIAAAISRKDNVRRPAKSCKGQEKEIEDSSHDSSPQASSLTTSPSESVTEVEHTKKDLSEVETMKMEQTSPRLTRVEIPTVGVALLQIPDTYNADEDASLNETVSSLGDSLTTHETAAKRRTESTKPPLQHNLEYDEKFAGDSISMTASSGSQTVWRFYEPEDTIIPAPPQVSEAETKQRQKRIEDKGKNIWRFYDPIEIESLCLSAKEIQHTEQAANAVLKLKEVSTTVDPDIYFSKCSSIQTSTHNGNERAPGFLEVHGQKEGRARDKDENSPPYSKDKAIADYSKRAVSDLSPHKRGCRDSPIVHGPELIDDANDGDPQPYDVSTQAIKVGDISQFIDPNTVAATAFFRHMMPVVKPTVAKPSPEEANSLFNQLVDEYKYARGNIELPTIKKVLDPKPRESLGHPRNSLASDSLPVTAVKAVREALSAIVESSIKVTTVAIESLPAAQAHSLQAKCPDTYKQHDATQISAGTRDPRALEEKGLRNGDEEVDLLQDEMRPSYDLAIDSDFTFSHLRSASEDSDDQGDIHRNKKTKLEDFEHVEFSEYLLESKSRSEPVGDKRECSSIIPEDPYPDADDDSSHANGSEASSLPSDCSHGSNIDEGYSETPQDLAAFTGDEELEGQDDSHHNIVHRERSEFSSYARDQTQNFSRDHPETKAFKGTKKDLDPNFNLDSTYFREQDEAETPRHANVSSFVLSGETREKKKSTFESDKPGQNVESKPFVDSIVSTSHSVVLDEHMFDVQNGTVPDYAIAAVVQLIDKFKAEHERNKMICSTRKPIEGLLARVSSLRSPALHRAEISNDMSDQHCYSSRLVHGETPSQRINTFASSFSVHQDNITRQYSPPRLETNDLDEDVDRYSSADDLDKYSASVGDVELDKYSSACEHSFESKRDQGNSSRVQIIAGKGRYHPLHGALLLGEPDSGGQHSWDGSYLLHIKNDKIPALTIGPSDSVSAISNLFASPNSASSERMSAIRSVARSVATDVFSKDFSATSSLGESKFTDQTSVASTAPSSGSSSGYVSGETKDGSSLGTNSIVATHSGSAASNSVGLNLSSIPSAEEISREFNTRATPPAESRVRVLDPYALDFPSNPWPNQGIVGTKPCADSMSEFLWNPIFSCKCGVRSSFDEEVHEGLNRRT